MRELTYYVAVSLDGRIASPDGAFDAFPVEGDHMQAIMQRFSDALPAPALEAMSITPDTSRFDTVLMGYSTYAVGLPVGLDDPYPHLRQYVFSRTSRDAPAGITVGDDPVATVRALKEEQGESGIWLCGGGKLAATLIGEIDRLILKVNPVVLGDGIPLFDGAYEPRTFRLENSTRYESGVLIDEYVRLGS
jgi:dihydrofolate reductase